MSVENESAGRGIPVKLPAFEGPLDLLLHLIEKNKIDIYDIPIVSITDQYMEYIRQMEKTDLGVMSDFLVEAATLLEIKARMLLPKEAEAEEEEEEDPRAELARRLAEYRRYRELAGKLKQNEEEAALTFYREPQIPPEVAAYEPPKDPKELIGDLPAGSLLDVLNEVLKRAEDKTDPVRSGFGDIKREEVSVEDRMAYVEDFLLKSPKTSFKSILSSGGGADRMQVIVTFLAVLELMKAGKVSAVQNETFGDIYIESEETRFGS